MFRLVPPPRKRGDDVQGHLDGHESRRHRRRHRRRLHGWCLAGRPVAAPTPVKNGASDGSPQPPRPATPAGRAGRHGSAARAATSALGADPEPADHRRTLADHRAYPAGGGRIEVTAPQPTVSTSGRTAASPWPGRTTRARRWTSGCAPRTGAGPIRSGWRWWPPGRAPAAGRGDRDAALVPPGPRYFLEVATAGDGAAGDVQPDLRRHRLTGGHRPAVAGARPSEPPRPWAPRKPRPRAAPLGALEGDQPRQGLRGAGPATPGRPRRSWPA